MMPARVCAIKKQQQNNSGYLVKSNLACKLGLQFVDNECPNISKWRHFKNSFPVLFLYLKDLNP